MKNPLIASRWAIESLSPVECWSFLGLTGGIAFQLGGEDMQKGLSLLENLKKWDRLKVDAGWPDGKTMYTELMAKFAAGAVASDPAKAIELAREYGSLYELAGHWATLDAQQATQWARSLTNAAECDAVVKAITWSLVNRGNRDDMVDWVNSLEANPAAYDKAATAMLEQLPQDELGPVLYALLLEPPPDALMALSLIRGIGGGGNRYAKGVLRGELLQQLASGLGEEWLNNAEVQSALKRAIDDAAKTIWQGQNANDIRVEGFRDAVDYTPNSMVFAEKTYHTYYDPMRAVRTKKWKLIANFEFAPWQETSPDYKDNAKCYVEVSNALKVPYDIQYHPAFEFYDIETDPCEQHNLADDPTFSASRNTLIQALYTWMVKTSDPLLDGPMAQGAYRERMRSFKDIGQQPSSGDASQRA